MDGQLVLVESYPKTLQPNHSSRKPVYHALVLGSMRTVCSRTSTIEFNTNETTTTRWRVLHLTFQLYCFDRTRLHRTLSELIFALCRVNPDCL